MKPVADVRGSIAPSFALSPYLPDRPPTWTEVLITALVVATVASRFLVRPTAAWPWFVAGFVVGLVALGPVANSGIGASVGRRFDRIGIAGRAVVIVLFGAGWLLLSRLPSVPVLQIGDAAVGGLLAIALFVAVHVATAREISGWIPGRQGADGTRSVLGRQVTDHAGDARKPDE